MSGILIMEDEYLIAVDLARAIERAGFEVIGVASSCPIAQHFAASVRPDLAIVDIRLSGPVDGLTCAQECLAGIPFIVHSGYSRADYADRLERGAPIAWIEKPSELGSLINVIADWYGSRLRDTAIRLV
jgi:DNA-binding NtrC family response regulator